MSHRASSVSMTPMRVMMTLGSGIAPKLSLGL
jgi:hypothetical protein